MRLVGHGSILSRLVRPAREAARWLRDRPIAHRGLHGAGAVENSLSAFDAAVASGYPIELDVRVASDGTPVVHHDADLDRLTQGRGPVGAHTWSELRALRLGGTQDTIASLEDVLDFVAGRVPLLVELKNGGPPGALEAAVAARLQTYSGEVAVQSFNPRTVAWFARHAPGIDRGLLATDFAGSDLSWARRLVLRRLGLAPISRPHFVGYELRCLPFWAPDLVRAAGLPLLAWTIRTPGQLRRARRLADNVIFEGVLPGPSGNERVAAPVGSDAAGS